jgi:aryl-alcohol dehydrogenase-like predicted oxidoreductase
MQHRTFGHSGLRISRAILGTMTFGEQGGVGAPLDECRRILTTFLEAGGTTIDTASNYRGGASEEFLGELLGGLRERVVLGTKYTVTRDPADPNAGGSSRRNLRASLDQSLRRLKTDHVDIMWVHMWDRHTPIEETMRALDDAVRTGKVLYVGISDAPAWLIARANTLADWRDWSAFIGIQVPYSLLSRDVERELLPMAAELGLSVAAWSPLGGGLLTGKYGDGPATVPTARLRDHQLSNREQAIVEAVREAATELDMTPAQVALGWVVARSPCIHPILGARSADQLRENLEHLGRPLPSEILQTLTDASATERGFPADFIDANAPWVLGAAGEVATTDSPVPR